ncbi:MAG: hypothetical protein R2851_00180 [Caldilineaceae bacterium]
MGGGITLSTSGGFAHMDRTGLYRADLLAGRTPRTINMNRLGDALSLDRPGAPWPTTTRARGSRAQPGRSGSAGGGAGGLQLQPGRGRARPGRGHRGVAA